MSKITQKPLAGRRVIFLFFNIWKPDLNEAAVIRSNLAKITAERDKMKKSLSDAEEAVKRANTDSERTLKQQLELTHEKATLEADRKHDEEIRKMKVEQQQEIDKYQQKYLSLLEKLERPEQIDKE